MHLSAEQVPLYKLVIAVYIHLYNIIMFVIEYLCIVCWFCIFCHTIVHVSIYLFDCIFFSNFGDQSSQTRGVYYAP